MSHDPFLPLVPYVSPYSLTKNDSSKGLKSSSADFSIDALVSNRSKILEVKFEVFSSLVRKRLEIRQLNLDSLLSDEIKIHNLNNSALDYIRSHTVENIITNEQLEEKLLKISTGRREEDRSCWRDITPVVRDLMLIWEALEQSKARASFLSSSTGSDHYGGNRKNE